MDYSKPRSFVDSKKYFSVPDLLPPLSEIPEVFREGSALWRAKLDVLVKESGKGLVPRPGIEMACARRHIGAILMTYQAAHKWVGATYLMSLWFEE